MNARLCAYCQRGFKPRLNVRQYCSRVCANQARAIPTTRKHCAQCQTEFLSSPRRKRFCSRACFLVWFGHLPRSPRARRSTYSKALTTSELQAEYDACLTGVFA